MGKEELIGWLYGRLIGRTYPPGYFLFVTKKRIVGTKKGRNLLRDTFVIRGDYDSKAIEVLKEIENVKDLEIHKDDILKITLKKPGWVSPGRLEIKTTKGDEKILVWGSYGWKEEYQKLKELMSKFYASVLEADEL